MKCNKENFTDPSCRRPLPEKTPIELEIDAFEKKVGMYCSCYIKINIDISEEEYRIINEHFQKMRLKELREKARELGITVDVYSGVSDEELSKELDDELEHSYTIES
jgi:hypothetical protein